MYLLYKTCTAFFAGLSAISCPLGIAAFVYFLFYASNVNAAVWSLLFAVFSACSLHLFILFLRRTINNWYQENHLDSIASFGLVAFLLSDVALGVYLSLAITRHQKFAFEDCNFFSAASCSALSSLWALNLFISALLYRRYMLKNPPLLQRYRSYS